MTDGFSCADCVNKTCLKSGRPCNTVEKLMRDEGIKSSDWIRPKMSSLNRKNRKEWREVPFSSLKNFDVWGLRDFKIEETEE